MSWSTYIIILVIAAVIGKVYFTKKQTELLEAGVIEERDSIAVRQEHTFYSKRIKNPLDIIEQMDKSFFKGINALGLPGNITITEGKDNTYIFTYKDMVETAYFGLFTQQAQEEFRFSLTVIEASNLERISLIFNIILTSMERAIKNLDPDVEVERTVQDFVKSKN